MQIPCVYIPGPAPAVSVANINYWIKYISRTLRPFLLNNSRIRLIFGIGPLSRPMNFQGRTQFCWAGFEFCGIKIGQLATLLFFAVKLANETFSSWHGPTLLASVQGQTRHIGKPVLTIKITSLLS